MATTQRKRQPAYKSVLQHGTVGSISGAFIVIEELASDCREIHNNMESGNLGQTQRCQTFGDTADTLENVSEIDIPECIDSIDMSWSEMTPTRKGRVVSRAVHRDNQVSLLQAAIDVAQGELDDNEDSYTEEEISDIQTFIDGLENVIGEVEGVEFPGMFG